MAARAQALPARRRIGNSLPPRAAAKRQVIDAHAGRRHVGIAVPTRARPLSAIEAAFEWRRTQHAAFVGITRLLSAILVPHKLSAVGLSRRRSVSLLSRSVPGEPGRRAHRA